MSIYPITVTPRLPVFVLLGHSNADGWMGVADMVDAYPHTAPATTTIVANPENAWYRNFYVFTSEMPWTGTLGTPATTSIGTGEWLEMCVGAPDTPAMPWPHPSPFVYPNNQGACYPHWYFKAYDSILLTGNNGARCGVEVPFQWFWRNHWNKQCGMVKVAFGTSLMLPADVGADPNPWLNLYSWTPADPSWLPGTIDTVNQGYDYQCWWTPRDCFDFAPSTGRFFQRWLDKMAGAQAALPSGTKMDVQLIIDWMGDNDSEGRYPDALTNIKAFIKELVYQQRKACVVNDWTTLPLEQIPVAWMGVFTVYGNDNLNPDGLSNHDYVNSQLAEIAAEDEYFLYIPTDDFATMGEESPAETSAIDTLSHFGSSGYYDAAQAIYDAWVNIQTDAFDAIAAEDRVTVEEVKDRVKTYYNRARVSTDIDDDTVLIHINAGLNRILNDVGDNAYWLRRRQTMTLSFENGLATMPPKVSRVLRIEDISNPTLSTEFEEIAKSSGGRSQIHIKGVGSTNSDATTSGAYTVHFITRPKELTRDDQLVPLPRTIVEWLVVETCRRLARSGSNIPLQASMEGEARELRDKCIKELQVTQRAKKDRLQNQGRQWRMPPYRR